MAQVLYLVAPCYNEAAILEQSVSELLTKLDALTAAGAVASGSRLLLVDDGSTDRTWEIICELHAAAPERLSAIRFAANRGHQNALWAGLITAGEKADLILTLDIDLQDDIDRIPEFVEKACGGVEVVYGIRADRSSDSHLKRWFAEMFYKLLQVMGVAIIPNHADYRLMSRRAVKALSEYHEVNLFLRGMVVQLGLPYDTVFYTRKRANRPTHYSLSKMIRLAWDGISSFSVFPIRIISCMGVLSVFVSLILLGYILFSKFWGYAVPGWTFLAVLIVMFGGVQVLSIGVIGEYIAKSYLETKHRPRYFILEKR